MSSEKINVDRGRLENFRLVTDRNYTADLVPHDAFHAVFFPSPIARGLLRSLSVDKASVAPDIVAVLTALEAA